MTPATELETHGAVLSAEDIGSLALFRQSDPHQIGPLVAACPIRHAGPGTVLIRAGQINDCVYFVLSGRLRVCLSENDTQPVAMIEAGESVGEIAVIDGQPAAANVCVQEAARLLVVGEGVLWAIVRQSHAVACSLLHTLAQRLRHGNTVIHRIQDLLREYEIEASVDPLTGLFNRRWLDRMTTRLVYRAGGGEVPLSVLMIDIDHFKAYNDAHGHVAGDRALICVARCLQGFLRPEDTLSRYGGEEMLALLPGTRRQDALQIAERLRQAVSQQQVRQPDGGALPPLTVSIGVAELQPGQSPEALIGAADDALYRAKRGGRNRVSP